jgi:hypothetical protein
VSAEDIRRQIVAEFVALAGERDLVRAGIIGGGQGAAALAVIAVGAVLARVIDARLATFAAAVRQDADADAEDALP